MSLWAHFSRPLALMPALAVRARAANGFTSRYLSTAGIAQKEVRDAYILSAARTPTAKVRTQLLGRRTTVSLTELTYSSLSSMAHMLI